MLRLGVAFEHAFDYAIPCARKLGDWLYVMSVAKEKPVSARNSASVKITPQMTVRGSATRKARPLSSSPSSSLSKPLRLLPLGRLDWQKGLGWLTEVIRRSQPGPLIIMWRGLCKAVPAIDAPTILLRPLSGPM
jgi:hypothetical protein